MDRDAVGDEVVRAQNRCVVYLFDAVGLDGHDRVPQHVVDCLKVQVRLIQHLRDLTKALQLVMMLCNNLPVVRRGEVDRRHHLRNPAPDRRSRLGPRPGARAFAHDVQQRPSLSGPVAMNVDLLEKASLVVHANDIERDTFWRETIARVANPAGDAKAQQEARDVVQESRRLRRQVDAPSAARTVRANRAVAHPKMLDEDGDLTLGRVEQRLGHEALGGRPGAGTTRHAAEVVRERGDLVVVRPGCELVRRWHVSRDSHARAGAQVTQLGPALIGQEGVVLRCADRLARRQGQTEDRLDPGREHVGQMPLHVTQGVIQRPHRNIGGAPGIQLSHRRLGARVCPQDPCVGGEATRLAKVAHLWPLVGALLATTVQL